jgi:leucyl-tRNA synthetase
MKVTGHLGVEEPFAGLFTQGMVTHESYRGADGAWLYPEQVEKRADGSAVDRAAGAPVTVGRVEAMSKSKRNTVDPGAIIARFGADTARWFILSDNPPDRDMEWTEAGVVGAYRFTQRLYRLSEGRAPLTGGAAPEEFSPTARALRRATHRCILAVSEALESFAFNVAVARIYELANAIGDADRIAEGEQQGVDWARGEALETIIRLSSPMMPHLAEEMYARLHPGSAGLVAELPWPEGDADLAAAETVTLAVQVMGKLRGTIRVAPGTSAAEVIAAAEDCVGHLLEGKRVVKRVHVPGRIVNFVVAG